MNSLFSREFRWLIQETSEEKKKKVRFGGIYIHSRLSASISHWLEKKTHSDFVEVFNLENIRRTSLGWIQLFDLEDSLVKDEDNLVGWMNRLRSVIIFMSELNAMSEVVCSSDQEEQRDTLSWCFLFRRRVIISSCFYSSHIFTRDLFFERHFQWKLSG